MRILSSIALAIFASFCAAAEPSVSAQSVDSALAKYEAKLAAQEIRIAALEARVAALEKSGVPAKAFSMHSVVESMITSDFEGLEMDKVFTLANGQIWRQTEPYIWIYIAVMPKVTIYPTDSGIMKMQVDGISRPVSVERLK